MLTRQRIRMLRPRNADVVSEEKAYVDIMQMLHQCSTVVLQSLIYQCLNFEIINIHDLIM